MHFLRIRAALVYAVSVISGWTSGKRMTAVPSSSDTVLVRSQIPC